MENVYQAVRDAFDLQLSNLSNQINLTAEDCQRAAYEQQRPCVLFKPQIYIDGDKWCALYGANIQDGVAGFGDTPAKAMIDFDINWLNQKAMKG